VKYLNSATKEQLNSLKGYHNKMAGETFENMINAACETYSNMELAYIEKTPEAFKITGKKKLARCLIFEGVFTKKCQPDFKGTLAEGRAICFEAKHTDTDSIHQDRVSEEQLKSLLKHDKLNAVSFVLVSIKMQNFYRIPIKTWQNMKAIYGRKHMKIEDLRQFEVPFKHGILNFLSGIDNMHS
jgi:recombination protein U